MGTFSILHNIAGMNAQNQLGTTAVQLNKSISRLASGKRINSGADDAAGLQIADSLRANVQALNQAVRNAHDGISVGQIADSALQEITNILTRGITLAEQSATGSVDSTSRASLQAEFVEIQAEIARIATQTNFNGVPLFTASGLNGSLSVWVGDIAGGTSISVTINTITASGNTVSDLGGQAISTINLATQSGGAAALNIIKLALVGIASDRAAVGAGINRLESSVAIMEATATNTSSAESTIRDANMAEEISNLTKYQMLTQTGIAALSQANQSSQAILALFKG